MVFGLGKSSHQSWTLGSYPGPPMLVTGVPIYPAASSFYSYAPQPVYPMVAPMPVSPPVQSIPVSVPVPVAVQPPVVQIPPLTTTCQCTGFQSVPSPVIYAPVTMPPANLPPARAPRTPRPRPPPPPSDAVNALMLVHTQQAQAPHSSPSNLTINFHMETPQQQPMQLHGDAVVQNQYPPATPNVNAPIIPPRPPTPPPDVITRGYHAASGTHLSVSFAQSPLPRMSPRLAPLDNW